MPWRNPRWIGLLLSLVTEWIALHPWVATLAEIQGPTLVPGAPWLFLYLAAAAGLAVFRPLGPHTVTAGLAAALMGGLWRAGLQAGPLSAHVLVLMVCWWRGTAAGRQTGEFGYARSLVGYGMDGMILLLVLRLILRLPAGTALLGLAGLLAAGLPLLAWSRLVELQQRWGPSDGAASLSGWWRISVAASMALVALGTAVGTVLFPDLVRTVGSGLGQFWSGVVGLLLMVLRPLFQLLEPLLQWLIAFLRNQLQDFEQEAPSGELGPDQPEPPPLPEEPALVSPELMGAILAVLGTVVVLLLLRALLRRRADAAGAGSGVLQESRVSTWSWGRLLEGIRRVMPQRGTEAGPVRQVRRLYRRLQRLGQRAGLPRRPFETPRQYAERLRQAGWPAEPVETITGLYHQVRYRSYLPPGQEVARAEGALQQLSHPGHRA